MNPSVVSSNFIHFVVNNALPLAIGADRLINEFMSHRGGEALAGDDVAWNSCIWGNCAEKSSRENDVLRFSVLETTPIFFHLLLVPVRGIHETLYFRRLTRPSADFWRVSQPLTLLFPCTLRRRYSYSKLSENAATNVLSKSLWETVERAMSAGCRVELKYCMTDRAKSLLAARACRSLNSIQPVPICGGSGAASIAINSF